MTELREDRLCDAKLDFCEGQRQNPHGLLDRVGTHCFDFLVMLLEVLLGERDK